MKTGCLTTFQDCKTTVSWRWPSQVPQLTSTSGSGNLTREKRTWDILRKKAPEISLEKAPEISCHHFLLPLLSLLLLCHSSLKILHLNIIFIALLLLIMIDWLFWFHPVHLVHFVQLAVFRLPRVLRTVTLLLFWAHLSFLFTSDCLLSKYTI